MEKEVSKKTGVTLLLAAIFLAMLFTFVILNYAQTPKVVEAGAKESGSSGEVSLTFETPINVKDESKGSVSLEILPSGGKNE